MPRKYLFISALVLALGIFIGGYKVAMHFAHARELAIVQAHQVTSQTVLLSLKGQGFLITQTYLFNQSIAIDHSSGSFFKDLFWSQVIAASANMKVSSGVDLSKLTLADIQQNGNKITVALPVPVRYSTEILGAVNVQNKQGVLKKVFDNDDGYNQALENLKAAAERAAETPELRQDVQQETSREVVRLVQAIMPDSEITIVFK